MNAGRNLWIAAAMALAGASCAPASYLHGVDPWKPILQRTTHGGVAALVGTELNGPTFSLYANGIAVYYQYVNGQRQLVQRRVARADFFTLMDRLKEAAGRYREDGASTGASELPVTELSFENRRFRVVGLGLVSGKETRDLEILGAEMDSMCGMAGQVFRADTVTLFVKRVPQGDPGKWPPWKVAALPPDTMARKAVSMYEPNVAENSRKVTGSIARKIQTVVTQASVYERFSWKGEVYLIGYRPELP